MSEAEPIVFVVDDEPSARKSRFWVRSATQSSAAVPNWGKRQLHVRCRKTTRRSAAASAR
jgi:hypothetical protein